MLGCFLFKRKSTKVGIVSTFISYQNTNVYYVLLHEYKEKKLIQKTILGKT